jgi:catechol 2,3-dioxygenase-like lactoylglutathione lyase family enzyme
MLRRVDRIVLRVPSVASAVTYYRDVLGLRLIKQDNRLASLRMAEGDAELVLHADPDLPAEAVYYLVDDVRALFEKRASLKVQFVQQPAAAARGYRAAIKDPFGNIMLIVDRTAETKPATQVADAPAQIEDGKPAGMLFSGMKTGRLGVKKPELVKAYEAVGRTADDLPYTPDFERLYATYATAFGAADAHHRPTKQEVWRHLLNLRKAGELPKLGEARSRPPAIEPDARARLRELVGDEMGKRDRLPYTDRFDAIVDAFNDYHKHRRLRPLSPHLVWRLVATLAK